MNGTIKADGKTYTYVAGTIERGIVTGLGPRGGQNVFVRNVHSGRWCLLAGNTAKPKTTWLTSFEVTS